MFESSIDFHQPKFVYHAFFQCSNIKFYLLIFPVLTEHSRFWILLVTVIFHGPDNS